MSDTKKYIYKMSFYNNRRCTVSHTDMYYIKEEHTRWGHDFNDGGGDICRIFVIEVDEDSNQYTSALCNSSLKEKKESDEED